MKTLRIASALPIIFFVNSYLYGQNQGVMQISSDIAVHFIVTDPQSRRTGVDPRGASKPWIGREIDEIPGANYSTSGVGDSPIENDPQELDNSHEFLYVIRSPENDGIYQIDCIGWKLRRFSLYVDLTPDDTTVMRPFRVAVRNIIDKDNFITYRFEYHGQHGPPIKFEKVVRSSTLRQDLAAAYKLKLLGDQKLFDDWNKEIDKFERDLARKDSAKARKELEKFGKEIDKQREETIKHEQRGQKDKRFITKDAYDILKEDVTILIKQLPEKKGK